MTIFDLVFVHRDGQLVESSSKFLRTNYEMYVASNKAPFAIRRDGFGDYQVYDLRQAREHVSDVTVALPMILKDKDAAIAYARLNL